MKRGASYGLAWLGLVLWWLSIGYSHADPLLDFSMFKVPGPSQTVIKAPVMSWLVRPDAERYCASAGPKDGHVSRPEGCVYWQLAAGKCTIVTTASTTHSQLGHLFLHCLQAK